MLEAVICDVVELGRGNIIDDRLLSIDNFFGIPSVCRDEKLEHEI